MAQNMALMWPIDKLPELGPAITNTPKNPISSETALNFVNFSFRKKGDRRAIQIGDVNSSETRSPKGIRGKA